MVGPEKICDLVVDNSLPQGANLEPLLNRFGNLVQAVIESEWFARLDRVTEAKKELKDVFGVVTQELERFQSSLSEDKKKQVKQIRPVIDTITGIPEVRCEIFDMPTMVVRVGRCYVSKLHRVTAGFRTREFCGGPLTGPIAHSITYLKSRLGKADYVMEISEVLDIWICEAMDISRTDRMNARVAHVPVPQMPQRQSSGLNRMKESPKSVRWSDLIGTLSPSREEGIQCQKVDTRETEKSIRALEEKSNFDKEGPHRKHHVLGKRQYRDEERFYDGSTENRKHEFPADGGRRYTFHGEDCLSQRSAALSEYPHYKSTEKGKAHKTVKYRPAKHRRDVYPGGSYTPRRSPTDRPYGQRSCYNDGKRSKMQR